MVYDKIVEFENRLTTHPNYTFKRYNQLKTVIIYLKSYFDNGGILTDKETQLEIDMELENELEYLNSLRYSQDKNADFVLRVNATLRIVGIMKHYVPEEIIVRETTTADNDIAVKLKQRLFPKANINGKSLFDIIHETTTTWSRIRP